MDGDSPTNMDTGLDLNQDPMISNVNYGSDSIERVNSRSPDELQSENMPIEQRIRFIQHLSMHTSQCPRWDQGGPSGTAGSNNANNTSTDVRSPKVFYENGRCYNSADLVAKALEKEMLDLKKEFKKLERKAGGSYYDCNVCLELAKEPVLTCCGHLYCWNCFYNIPYANSFTKECPVCAGEVSDSTLIPIYGNGDVKRNDRNEVCSSKIPPRPKAHRVESVRPQRPVSLSHVPVVDALRRIRLSFGNSPDQAYQRTVRRVMDPRSTQNANRLVARRRLRTRQVTRVLSETAASVTNLPSSLGNPGERRSELRLVRSGVNTLTLDVSESDNGILDSNSNVGIIALPVITSSSSQPTDISGSVPNGTTISNAVPSHPYNLRSRSRSRSRSTSTNTNVGNRGSNVSRRRLN